MSLQTCSGTFDHITLTSLADEVCSVVVVLHCSKHLQDSSPCLLDSSFLTLVTTVDKIISTEGWLTPWIEMFFVNWFFQGQEKNVYMVKEVSVDSCWEMGRPLKNISRYFCLCFLEISVIIRTTPKLTWQEIVDYFKHLNTSRSMLLLFFWVQSWANRKYDFTHNFEPS